VNSEERSFPFDTLKKTGIAKGGGGAHFFFLLGVGGKGKQLTEKEGNPKKAISPLGGRGKRWEKIGK